MKLSSLPSYGERIVYLLLLALLPTQLGKHFWPSFSFVGGLRVDYLSVTLYLTDLLIVFLFALSVHRFLLGKKNHELRITNYGWNKKFLLLIAFILSVCLGIVFAKNQGVAIYGLVKLLEMMFFGWYTARVVVKEIPIIRIAYALGAGFLLESLLAIIQFFSHGSLGGIWYLIGERTFSTITPGIAVASIQGQLVLRPYGTLPHPNVLAGFLLIAMIFIVSLWTLYTKVERILASLLLCLGIFALFLTLSRTTICLFSILLICGFFISITTWKKRLIAGVIAGLGLLTGLVLFGSVILGRFMSSSFLEESFLVRVDLLSNAWWMIASHPFWGVGLLNFLVNLPAYQQTQNFYLHLQPVHNIFFLLFAETGIFGMLAVVGFLFFTIRHVWKAHKTPLRLASLWMLMSIFFLGMFDHYFLTLQQGQLLLAFTLGLSWSAPLEKKSKSKKRNR